MEIGNTQKTYTLFRLLNFTERIQIWRWQHTDKQALIRLTLKKGFVMELATHRQNKH